MMCKAPIFLLSFMFFEVVSSLHAVQNEDLKGILRLDELKHIEVAAVYRENAVLKEPFSKRLSVVETDAKSGSCACVGYNCGCCLHVEVKKIDLNDTVCANFSYLPAPDYGISITLTVDDRTLFNETVSARNPPPICAGVPYLKKYASLCLRFKNLTIHDHSLSGCVSVVAKLEGFKVEELDLGCFTIPPTSSPNKIETPLMTTNMPAREVHVVDDNRSNGYPAKPTSDRWPPSKDIKIQLKKLFAAETRFEDTALHFKPRKPRI